MAAHTPNALGLTNPTNIDPLKISVAAKDIGVLEWKGDLLSVGVTEKDMAKNADMKFENCVLKKLDSSLGGLLSEASSEEDFSGKAGQSIVVRFPGLSYKRVALIGIGSLSGGLAAYKSLGEAVAVAAKTAQANSVAVALASSDCLSAEFKLNTTYAIASGTVLGAYEDNRFKSESKKLVLKSLDVIGLGDGPDLVKKLKYVEDVSSGVIFGMELVNLPANLMNTKLLLLLPSSSNC